MKFALKKITVIVGILILISNAIGANVVTDSGKWTTVDDVEFLDSTSSRVENLVNWSNTVSQYVNSFNNFDSTEMRIVNAIPNSKATDWIIDNVPMFECSDKQLEEMYYYRWWTYRKHIRNGTSGYVISEFLFNVGWAGMDNSISAAAGHHFYEGRWINNRKYLKDYANFWLKTNTAGALDYSSWIPAGLYAFFQVDGDKNIITANLTDAVVHFRRAEQKWFDASTGLYHIIPDRDAMEMPVSGTGEQYRPSINSYAYGNAIAIANMASLTGDTAIEQEFNSKAMAIKSGMIHKLWDASAGFFKVVYRGTTTFSSAREEVGFTPWYFNIPSVGNGFEIAWKQITDNNGFYAPYGPTSVERRNVDFRANAGSLAGEHECQWNGPSWPFATSQTLVAMGNVLRNYNQVNISKSDYLSVLNGYTRSQHKDGHPWIAEDLNPLTGKWIADISWRSESYNHSTYNDLIIGGLVGIVPRSDSIIEINPLLPDSAWDYFCLTRVLYHNLWLTIIYDKTGTHYNKGQGLLLFVNGELKVQSATLSRITWPSVTTGL